MCGIFLYISNSEFKQQQIELITKEAMKIKSRGPDNTVTRIINNNFIMFHRLKINDISDNGNQPIIHPNDYNLILICNGEIYNHKSLIETYNFKTKSDSDCEVIIHLYEKFGIEKTVKLLDGVFAFAIIDNNKNKIFAARDPIGVRSLYIGKNDENIVISSELKSLNNLTDNITQFKPGHYWCNEKGYQQYYFLDFPCIQDSETEILENIKKLLEKSVKKRMLSDRPIGCLLSGGLDSSLITSLVSKYYKKGELYTFSVGLEGSEDLRYAKKVADFLETSHYEIILSEEEMLDAIKEVIYVTESYDTTTIRASTPMYLLCKYIKENTDITVVFSGEGSDEASGSYMYFHNAPNEIEFQDECVRLIKDLSYFDVLRCDKCISDAGLEARVPFLDKEFLKYYMSINSRYKMPKNYKMEKFLLRKSFDNNSYLPDEVLWRMKEGMSDGVSSQKKGWFQIIQDHVNQKMSDDHFNSEIKKYNFNPPKTKEALYFREIYNNHFKSADKLIPYYWLPKWCGDISEASARVLDVYKKNNKL
jgi:asparagine synthase (glutamine-hydrolysing)